MRHVPVIIVEPLPVPTKFPVNQHGNGSCGIVGSKLGVYVQVVRNKSDVNTKITFLLVKELEAWPSACTESP